MSQITNVLRKTLSRQQLVGYLLSLCLGLVIIFCSIQLYNDLVPVLKNETDVFTTNAVVISKRVSLFKTRDKSKVYFTEDDLDDLRDQGFVKKVSYFTPASFKVSAVTGRESADVPQFYSELFFEAIPDQYLDVKTDDWYWDTASIIPIVIPEDYLNLYNFGFAESQGLPVFSQNTVSQIQFNIRIRGHGKKKTYGSRIVGFSSKINSILVPQNFMDWANETYGSRNEAKVSRLLVEFKNPTDERILEYVTDKNYSMSSEELESNKLAFFFKLAFAFVLIISLIISILSLSSIVLSLFLMIQKREEVIQNLFQMGVGSKRIVWFYFVRIVIYTLITAAISAAIAIYIRNIWQNRFDQYFDAVDSGNVIVFAAIGVLALISLIYYVVIRRKISSLSV